MNWDIFEGQWKLLKGKLFEEWGTLVSDERLAIAGKRDQMIGRLQSRHGVQRELANQQVATWMARG